MVERHFLYGHGAGGIIKQNCSARNTSNKFLGCSHDTKIEAMIVPINASKGYVDDNYGSIFQQLPSSKLSVKSLYFKSIQ